MKRDIDIQSLLDFSTQESSVLIVEGARQVGKTYFLNNLMSQDIFSGKPVIKIDLEREKNFRAKIDSTADFDEFTLLLRGQKGLTDGAILFIDEAQESERLGEYVRYMKESWANVKTILTGSSMTKLFSKDTRIPVGRISYLVIHPFSFREFLRYLGKEHLLDSAIELVLKDKVVPLFLHEELITLFDQFLFCGGMPSSVIAFAEKKDFTNILGDLIFSQQEDFLRKEKNIASDLYMMALKGVANHIGSSSKLTHISDNYHSAKKIVDILKNWFLLFEIEQRGSLETQSYLPKRYLYDIGILRQLRETAIAKLSVITTIDEKLRIPIGGLLENAVLIELLRNSPKFHNISSWKKSSKDDIEVDFIFKRKDRTLPIEVKASVKISNRHAKNLVHYLNDQNLKDGLLVSLSGFKRFCVGEKNITNVPAYLLSENVLEAVFNQK